MKTVNQEKQLYDKIAAGERIRRLRKQYGITRHQIASRIGRTEKYYADIERGYCGMSVETMIEIADCLGVTLDYIVFGSRNPEEMSQNTERILFYLENCSENKQRKAVELLKLYLSE